MAFEIVDAEEVVEEKKSPFNNIDETSTSEKVPEPVTPVNPEPVKTPDPQTPQVYINPNISNDVEDVGGDNSNWMTNEINQTESSDPLGGAKKAAGMIFGISTAVVLSTLFILYESGLISKWLRKPYLKSSSWNFEFIRRLIVGGTLAHWKNKKGSYPQASSLEEAVKSREAISAVPLYEKTAVMRCFVDADSGELIIVDDYDLYESFRVTDKMTQGAYIFVYFDVRTNNFVVWDSLTDRYRHFRYPTMDELSMVLSEGEWL